MRRMIVPLAVFGVAAAFCLPAAASINVGDRYRIDHHPSFGQSQGPFELIRTYSVAGEPLVTNPADPLVRKTQPSTWDDAYFWTFCVERSEYFMPGRIYDVKRIVLTTYNTGRFLTGYTAWMYTMFREVGGWQLPWAIRSGGITGAEYNYLQNAAWAGMVGTSGVVGGGGAGGVGAELAISNWDQYNALGIGYNDFLASNWGGAAATEAQALAYLGLVRVLNIVTLSGGLAAQDQLVLIPEPATIIVWGLLGLVAAGYGLWRRRRAT